MLSLYDYNVSQMADITLAGIVAVQVEKLGK
jgi:hypothetical protein